MAFFILFHFKSYSMENVFFNNWDGIIRVSVTTVISYLLVVFMLRLSGKRTLAKMNAYDFIVTIALGSIMASVILTKNIPLAEGLFAIFLLIILQYIFTFLSVRYHKFRNLVTSEATLLFYEGTILHRVLKKQRITMDELNKAVRAKGLAGYTDIKAIVLEPTGDITIIEKGSNESDFRALKGVENFVNEN